jgi:hypothetical protein
MEGISRGYENPWKMGVQARQLRGKRASPGFEKPWKGSLSKGMDQFVPYPVGAQITLLGSLERKARLLRLRKARLRRLGIGVWKDGEDPFLFRACETEG